MVTSPADILECTRVDDILVLTMQRERRRNAIDAGLTAALDAALNELDDNPDLRTGVLTGAGSVFSAGTDLEHGSGAPTARGGEYGLVRRHRVKPLIAAVDGPALGGGFELVLACDLVVASTASSFSLPEVRRGVVAACGALFRTARALPRNIATELLLTGEPLAAERAHALGLVNVLTEPGKAVESALELAGRLRVNGPVSIRETLRALDSFHAASDETGWTVTQKAIETVLASEDCREGIRAFADKRAPRWTGR